MYIWPHITETTTQTNNNPSNHSVYHPKIPPLLVISHEDFQREDWTENMTSKTPLRIMVIFLKMFTSKFSPLFIFRKPNFPVKLILMCTRRISGPMTYSCTIVCGQKTAYTLLYFHKNNWRTQNNLSTEILLITAQIDQGKHFRERVGWGFHKIKI